MQYYLIHNGKYDFIFMDVNANRTFIHFSNTKPIEIQGLFINTLPSAAISLADRLTKLKAFLWAVPVNSAKSNATKI